MSLLLCHNYLMVASFGACVAGLSLLFAESQVAQTDVAERGLMRLIFTYWMVYCASVGLRKLGWFNWDVVVMSLNLTAVLSYLLTLACVLTLPLQHLAASRQEID